MEIKRAGTEASTKGSSDYFTGTVRIDPLAQAPAPSHIAIQEQFDAKAAEWTEQVSDDQYVADGKAK